MLNYRLPRVFVSLIALSLLLAWRSEAQTFTSPEAFGVYKSFPPIHGTVVSRNADAVTVTIRRTGQSWDGSGWVDIAFSNPRRKLATTLVGNRWSYSGALPKEDGVYMISVTVHSGDSGHGTERQIRVESGKNPATPPDAAGNGLSLGSFAVPVFKPVIKIGLGDTVRNVVLADFNGDKKLDMVVGSGVNRISLLLGDGTGGFATTGDFAVKTFVSFIAAGDFNSDGKADVAVSSSNINSVSLFLGDGTGQLGPATRIPVGDGPQGIVAHDFNRDGKLDLATANYGANVRPDTVSILYGEGTGHFKAARNLTAGDGPGFMAVSDFNADGRPDLAVTNHHSANVSIFLGNESGFDPQLEVGVGDSPGHLATGDFNADGKIDLATANGHRWSNRQHSISILLGDGRGGFQSRTQVLAGVQPQAIAAADLNSDGKIDLCIADAPIDRLILLLGDGKGDFSAPIILPVGTNPMLLALADFDADEKPDIAAVTLNSISILLRTSPQLAGKANQNQVANK